jgi:hypothetical protein
MPRAQFQSLSFLHVSWQSGSDVVPVLPVQSFPSHSQSERSGEEIQNPDIGRSVGGEGVRERRGRGREQTLQLFASLPQSLILRLFLFFIFTLAFLLLFLGFFAVLGIEPRALCVVSKCSVNELCSQHWDLLLLFSMNRDKYSQIHNTYTYTAEN